MKVEGWYRDPYRIHQDRWYSDGTPTALVRDGGAESKDPPPRRDAPEQPLVHPVADGGDGRGDPGAGATSSTEYSERAWEAAADFMGIT